MTRAKALEASRALDAVDGFQAFMDEVDKAIQVGEDFATLSPEFKAALNELLETELARLNKVLADL